MTEALTVLSEAAQAVTTRLLPSAQSLDTVSVSPSRRTPAGQSPALQTSSSSHGLPYWSRTAAPYCCVASPSSGIRMTSLSPSVSSPRIREICAGRLSASARVKEAPESKISVPATAAETVKRSSPFSAFSTALFAAFVIVTRPSEAMETPSASGSMLQRSAAPTGSSAPSVTAAAKGSLTKGSPPSAGTLKSVRAGAVIVICSGVAAAKAAVMIWSAVMPPMI